MQTVIGRIDNVGYHRHCFPIEHTHGVLLCPCGFNAGSAAHLARVAEAFRHLDAANHGHVDA